MCQKLGFKEAIDQSLYLSLPNTMDRKIDNFWVLKEKMQSHIQGWDKKTLWDNGVLLKTIAQTLPMYVMNVFLLPLDLCQQLESAK